MLQALIEERLADRRYLADAAGREIPTVVFDNCAPDKDTIKWYRQAGLEWCRCQGPPRGPDEVLPALDRLAKLSAVKH